MGVEGLALHRFTADGPPGVLLGYGNLSEPAIEQGVRLLGEAYRETHRQDVSRYLRTTRNTPTTSSTSPTMRVVAIGCLAIPSRPKRSIDHS